MQSRFPSRPRRSLCLAGCSIFQTSPTWDNSVSRSRNIPADGGSTTYVERHHRSLAADAGIEHKIVIYQFRYHPAYREDAAGSGTAILYRDDHTPRFPWWVMDEYGTCPSGSPTEARRAVEILPPPRGGSGRGKQISQCGQRQNVAAAIRSPDRRSRLQRLDRPYPAEEPAAPPSPCEESDRAYHAAAKQPASTRRPTRRLDGPSLSSKPQIAASRVPHRCSAPTPAAATPRPQSRRSASIPQKMQRQLPPTPRR